VSGARATVPAMSKDFEFVYGKWNILNRKLVDPIDPDCDEWIEFPTTSDVYPILDGHGHIEHIYGPEAPTPFEGFTLRLFDPTEDLWRIWWSATSNPGVLDVPVTGRFEGTHGTFESDDVLGGRPARVRFEWLAENPAAPVWQQSFSFDGGTTFRRNWVMEFTPR